METIKIKLENLYLDPNNYRLRSNPDWVNVDQPNILKPAIQKRTTSFISGENNYKINDLIESIKSNGFLKVDNILVRKYEGSENYVVVEGNRRVASLKILQEQNQKGYDLGKLDTNIFEHGIDVVLYSYLNEKDYLILMGLKHVSGNKKWDFYNQAKLLNELKISGEPEIDIARKIGISKGSVEQQIKGFRAIQKFLDEIKFENFGDKYDPYQKLQMFIDLTTKPKLKKWVGWNEEKQIFENAENINRFFSWITPKFEESEDTGEQEIIEPIIISHKQVRDLENIIDEPESLEFMEQTRNFQEALNQNSVFSQAQFSKIIKSVEKTLRNIPVGTTLSINNDDRQSLEVIRKIVDNLLNEN